VSTKDNGTSPIVRIKRDRFAFNLTVMPKELGVIPFEVHQKELEQPYALTANANADLAGSERLFFPRATWKTIRIAWSREDAAGCVY
jgi:hypothetical protein